MKKKKCRPILYMISIACVIGLIIIICIVKTMCQVGSSETSLIEEPISRYFGSNRIAAELLVYDIQVTQNDGSAIQITFKRYLDDTIFQTITYPLREDFMPKTVMDGMEIMDVNSDGVDDFLFDLGIYGQMRLKACLVYNDETQQFVFVNDFEELNNPTFLNGYFVTEPMPMDAPRIFDKYLLDGIKLCHVGRLSITDYSDTQKFYTESEQVNGAWIITKDMVTENNIDLSSWGLLPQ